MYNYCTYFDSHYIHRGLALYDSFVKVCPNEFTLYVMAFDDDCYNYLKKLNLPNTVVENLNDFETPELLEAKANRTRVEYCWTCGPSVIYHFLVDKKLQEITYVDSDLMFFSSPKAIFDEIDDNSVAITQQKYTTKEVPEGKYCVQYMYFKNDADGVKVLKWWRDSCLEWCYSQYEDERFGDQKYLEKFFDLSDKVVVLQNRGAGVAPWNTRLLIYNGYNVECEGKKYPIVFFHYHGVKFEDKGSVLDVYPTDGAIYKPSQYLFEDYAKAMIGVYNKYLNVNVNSFKIHTYSVWKMLYANIKFTLRGNKIVQWLYWDVLKVRYNGHESKKI